MPTTPLPHSQTSFPLGINHKTPDPSHEISPHAIIPRSPPQQKEALLTCTEKEMEQKPDGKGHAPSHSPPPKNTKTPKPTNTPPLEGNFQHNTSTFHGQHIALLTQTPPHSPAPHINTKNVKQKREKEMATLAPNTNTNPDHHHHHSPEPKHKPVAAAQQEAEEAGPLPEKETKEKVVTEETPIAINTKNQQRKEKKQQNSPEKPPTQKIKRQRREKNNSDKEIEPIDTVPSSPSSTTTTTTASTITSPPPTTTPLNQKACLSSPTPPPTTPLQKRHREQSQSPTPSPTPTPSIKSTFPHPLCSTTPPSKKPRLPPSTPKKRMPTRARRLASVRRAALLASAAAAATKSPPTQPLQPTCAETPPHFSIALSHLSALDSDSSSSIEEPAPQHTEIMHPCINAAAHDGAERPYLVCAGCRVLAHRWVVRERAELLRGKLMGMCEGCKVRAEEGRRRGREKVGCFCALGWLCWGCLVGGLEGARARWEAEAEWRGELVGVGVEVGAGLVEEKLVWVGGRCRCGGVVEERGLLRCAGCEGLVERGPRV